MQPTGVANGLLMEVIIPQSNVKALIPKPVFVPNNILMVALLGVIQQTQLKILKPVKR